MRILNFSTWRESGQPKEVGYSCVVRRLVFFAQKVASVHLALILEYCKNQLTDFQAFTQYLLPVLLRSEREHH